MKVFFRKASLPLLWFSTILLLNLTALGQVRVESTSQYVNNASYSWRIFIQADNATLNSIGCVEYRLDPSFARSVRQVCQRGDARYPFAESGEALRSFKVGVTVKFKNRNPIYIERAINLTREIAVSPQVRIKSNTSKVLDQTPFQNRVAIYVSGGNANSYRLKIYENFGSQRAFFEKQMSSDVKADFYYNGQPYVLRGITRGAGAKFDLYCTVYRVVIR